MVGIEKRLAELERRLAPLRPLPTTIDGLDVSALSYVAVDVLEMVTRAWPDDHLPSGLCAAVAAACDRPPAARALALGMVLGKYWPESAADHPLDLVVEFTRFGMLPGRR